MHNPFLLREARRLIFSLSVVPPTLPVQGCFCIHPKILEISEQEVLVQKFAGKVYILYENSSVEYTRTVLSNFRNANHSNENSKSKIDKSNGTEISGKKAEKKAENFARLYTFSEISVSEIKREVLAPSGFRPRRFRPGYPTCS